MEGGRIIDMLESREMEDVSKWLSEYPNIQFVSRDGSQTYASAIFKAHPNACQISDRFHILKNLTDAAILYFQKIFKGRVSIPITSKTAGIRQSILTAPTKKEKILLVKKLYSDGKSKSEIKSIINASDRVIKKYVNMKEEDIPAEKQVVRKKQHIAAVNKVLAKVNLVKSLKEKGYSIYKISKETGFTKYTIKQYLSPYFNPVNAHYGNRRNGLLSPYRDEIINLRSEGKTYREIFGIIQNKGYTGTEDAIRGYMTKERRIEKDLQDKTETEPSELIERKWLIRLLFKPLNDVKGINEEQFKAVIEKYPTIESIYETVRTFKELVFSKKAEELPIWMEKTELLGIEEINSFINGLKNDIAAVRNAIILKYNNGLAEGSINKLKVIKRIMYGRNKFDLLRNKVLMLESQKIN